MRSDYLAKAAGWITDRLILPRRSRQSLQLQEEVLLLASGRREAIREYYIRKWTMLLKVIPCLIGIAAALVTMYAGRQEQVEKEGLARPSYGEEDSAQEILFRTQDAQENDTLPVSVRSRRYTDQEAEELIDEAIETFDGQMLADNESANEVTGSLSFPETFCDGSVKVRYDTDPYGMIDADGQIIGTPGKDGTLVEIHAEFTCQEKKKIYMLSVLVRQRPLSAREQFEQEVREALTEADSQTATGAYLPLPELVSGRTLSWYYPEDTSWRILLVLLILLPFLLYYVQDSKTHEQAQNRTLQLEADYPDLLWKLTMLLGAGLTIRSAFVRTAAGYISGTDQHKYLREEMLITCREMKAGVSQAQAYENFGKRCGLPCYVKLGSTLSEDLKKGSKGLAQQLEREASEAMIQRKNTAKRLGEKAGTKILMPMILMMLVVMVVLMVPAFMSM